MITQFSTSNSDRWNFVEIYRLCRIYVHCHTYTRNSSAANSWRIMWKMGTASSKETRELHEYSNNNTRMIVYDIRAAKHYASRSACSANGFERRENVASTVHTVGTPPVPIGRSVRLSVSWFPHSIAMYGTRDDVLSPGPYAHLP